MTPGNYCGLKLVFHLKSFEFHGDHSQVKAFLYGIQVLELEKIFLDIIHEPRRFFSLDFCADEHDKNIRPAQMPLRKRY